MILLSEKNTMTFEQFQEQFIDWTINVIEAKRDSGFPICPFARKARLQGKIQFIDARDLSLEKFREFDDTTYEIGIAWIEGNDVDSIPDMLEVMHKENPELLYFISTKDSGHFAKNFQDCVFIQLRGDLEEKRAYLHSTSYYDSWPEDYYKSIVG